MSDKKEKTTADVQKTNKEAKDKAKKAAAPAKKENRFKKAGAAIKRFFKDFKSECTKVTWPSGKTVLNSSLVVIAVVVIVGLVIFGIDQALAAIIKAILGLMPDDAAESTAQMISMFLLK